MAQQVLESTKNRGKMVQNVKGKESWRRRRRRTMRKNVKQHEKKNNMLSDEIRKKT